MDVKIHHYPITIKETHLDIYSHVNNTAYLILFEEARWEMITKNGYGLKKIMETGLGPVILEITIRFQHELHARDEVVIETKTISYQKKICKIVQKMVRGSIVCATAEITLGLFDLKERKLVLPTQEWLKALA